jgi:hypothetical protein
MRLQHPVLAQIAICEIAESPSSTLWERPASLLRRLDYVCNLGVAYQAIIFALPKRLEPLHPRTIEASTHRTRQTTRRGLDFSSWSN